MKINYGIEKLLIKLKKFTNFKIVHEFQKYVHDFKNSSQLKIMDLKIVREFGKVYGFENVMKSKKVHEWENCL